MNIDKLFGFWLKDVPYLLVIVQDKCYRYYFLRDKIQKINLRCSISNYSREFERYFYVFHYRGDFDNFEDLYQKIGRPKNIFINGEKLDPTKKNIFFPRLEQIREIFDIDNNIINIDLTNVNVKTELSFIYKIEEEQLRIYIVIKNPKDQEIQILRDNGLEILNSKDEFLVFIQKHSEDDIDYTPDTKLGFDIFETYELINKMVPRYRYLWSKNTKEKLDEIFDLYKINILFTPAYSNFDKLLKKFEM